MTLTPYQNRLSVEIPMFRWKSPFDRDLQRTPQALANLRKNGV